MKRDPNALTKLVWVQNELRRVRDQVTPDVAPQVAKDLSPVFDALWSVCMDCTRARARCVANHHRCTCGRKGRARIIRTSFRSWVACERCLGTVRQLN